MLAEEASESTDQRPGRTKAWSRHWRWQTIASKISLPNGTVRKPKLTLPLVFDLCKNVQLLPTCMLLCERGVQSSGTLLAAAQPLARAHLLSHIDRLSQPDGPIDTARIKLRAGRAGRSDSIPPLIGAAQRRRSGCLAARRLGGTFLFPTLRSLFTYKDKPV